MSFTYKTRTRHSILQYPTHYTVCLPLSQIRYYMEYGACSVSSTYITYRVIRILHYIACCVNRYVSKERMPDHADDKHKISVKSRNPEVQQCWRVLLELEGAVGGPRCCWTESGPFSPSAGGERGETMRISGSVAWLHPGPAWNFLNVTHENKTHKWLSPLLRSKRRLSL